MDGDDCGTTVRMTHKMMTSLDADNGEARLLKGTNKFPARDPQPAHTSTATRWTPTNSDVSVPLESSTSKQSEIAS